MVMPRDFANGASSRRRASHCFVCLSQASSVLILSGRCYQQESVAYKAWDVAIDVLAQHLRRLPVVEQTRFLPRFSASLQRIFPVLGQVRALAETRAEPEPGLAANEVRRRAFAAFRELMARLSDQHRLVIVLDDLHWADEASLRLVHHIRLYDPVIDTLDNVCRARPGMMLQHTMRKWPMLKKQYKKNNLILETMKLF